MKLCQLCTWKLFEVDSCDNEVAAIYTAQIRMATILLSLHFKKNGAVTCVALSLQLGKMGVGLRWGTWKMGVGLKWGTWKISQNFLSRRWEGKPIL